MLTRTIDQRYESIKDQCRLMTIEQLEAAASAYEIRSTQYTARALKLECEEVARILRAEVQHRDSTS